MDATETGILTEHRAAVLNVKAASAVMNFTVRRIGSDTGTEFERVEGMEELDLSSATLVFDRPAAGRIFSCAAVFASGALFFQYLSRSPEDVHFVPFLGLILLILGTVLSALMQYGDRIYVSPDGVLFHNRLLSFLGRQARWLAWRDVVEVREIRRKILVLLSEDGRRIMVDAVTGYALARKEILKRVPHAVISGTLTRADRS